MKLTRAQHRIAQKILTHERESFVDIAKLAGFDPWRSFQDGDFRGVDFGADNLAGFNFAGADLRDTDFSRARGLDRAKFGDAWTNAGTKGLTGRVFHGPPMVFVPPGDFMMGLTPHEGKDEGFDDDWRKRAQPRHRVRIETGFLLGKYPVTRGEYAVFARETNRARKELYFEQNDRHPAVGVSWKDAVAYTAWLSEKTGRDYRLPSEAEWEYACRAGTVTARYWGDTFDATRANSTHKGTTEVGAFAPNPLDLHDMLGNVWEWCADHWHANYKNAPKNQTIWTTSDSNASSVLRGGAWSSNPGSVRADSRLRSHPRYGVAIIGFRVARALQPL